MKLLRTLLAAAGVAVLLAPAAQASDALPTNFNVDLSQTSVSGLSSGAFMAVQLQVAYSGSIKGAGIVAGGPYYCAAGYQLLFSSVCMGQGVVPPNESLLVQAANGFAAEGKIDPLSNLAKRRIYAYSGTMDIVVQQKAMNSTVRFFQQVGVPDANLQYVNTVPSGHAVIQPDYGNACAANLPPFISHCKVGTKSYDQAGAVLSFLHGPLNAKNDQPAGRLVKFDQRAFAAADTSMAADAFLYVPPSCEGGKNACKVHVAIHGCAQSYDTPGIGDKFVAHTGYNEWADTNNLLVLYPQVNSSLKNLGGCWDWTGYTGADYAWKSGAQMKAIMSMVQALGSGAAEGL